jgi:hypothetical protein
MKHVSKKDKRWPPPTNELVLIESRPGFIDQQIYRELKPVVTKLSKSRPLTDKERGYLYDRYFMGLQPTSGTKPLTSTLVAIYLSYMARFYEWEECYELNNRLESKCNLMVKKYMSKVSIKDPNVRQEYEDVYHFFMRYEVTEDHSERLYQVSEWTGLQPLAILEMDMMIRIRKMAFMNPLMSIRTKRSVDYLYFIFRDDVRKDYTGHFIKVGQACPICLREKDLQVCSRCRETGYCCKDHQVKHWPQHKYDCIVSS